jgi:3-polyprenyl-4-hydroxybenzoate decarboxylase
MSWHVQPARDVYVYRDTATVALDPSISEDLDQLERQSELSSKVGIDATRKHHFPARSVPPRDDLDRVDAQWADYGFPIGGER